MSYLKNKHIVAEELARTICTQLHGNPNAVGVPIWKACLQSAMHALDMMEAHGWGPYFED